MYYYKANCGIIAVNSPIDGAEEITSDEYTQLKTAIKTPVWTEQMQEQYRRTRPLTESEVTLLMIAQQINTLSVDDATAMRMTEFYPGWAAGVAYTTGYKVQHGGKLWRCLQAHTAQTGWEPENVQALWTEICESHAGTEDDPIPYDGNMELENGKYYIQDYVIYKCTRDTINPVYHPLSDLVGIYVEIA